MASQTFPRIAEAIDVGPIRLANRLVMGSMHTGLEADPDGFCALARFYGERAKGGIGLIVTGGFAPNIAGRVKTHASEFNQATQIPAHRQITEAVHAEDGRIILQILHAGRYGYHADIVAPSPIKSRINRHAPRQMTAEEIAQTIADYAQCADLAMRAGYDGVEIMASEGYLISQFLAPATNQRDDNWGGALASRARFPLAIVAAVRRVLGQNGLLSYRISALELIEGGLSQNDILWLAQALEQAGADCLSTGIGWHESPVPTIAGIVPHAAFAEATAALKQAVRIPVTASNRINDPMTAERILQSGQADLISMARPLLADAAFAAKAFSGRATQINLCIACNQACLDHYFKDQVASCLVNPWAVNELNFNDKPAPRAKRVGVIGAGVAGIACALEAAKRGHQVSLFDAAPRIGGQLCLAARIPGKEDYGRAIDAFAAQLADLQVRLRLATQVSADDLAAEQFDELIIATGIHPRPWDIPGADDPRIVGYSDILNGRAIAGEHVLIIGGGGIGHDVALFLAHPPDADDPLKAFNQHWGIGVARQPLPSPRQVTMLKRSPGPFGRSLGASTGWILRQELRDFGVRQIADAQYQKVDALGLHIRHSERNEILPADTIVVCAGQVSNNQLAAALSARGIEATVIGGARLAGELDAKRAIAEGASLGNRL